jgi:hypothetical protein
MPRIIVTADDPGTRVMLSERVTPSDFETDHFRAQLAERVAWAVSDAENPPVAPGDSAAGTRAQAHAA